MNNKHTKKRISVV